MKRETLKPLHDYIIVQPVELVKQTEGGILLPDIAQEQEHRGAVLAIGPGLKDENGQIIPMSVCVGEEVVYMHQASKEVEFEGTKCIILSERDVLATVRD